MIFLETERLIIKVTAPDNFEPAIQLFADPEVMRYIGRGVRTADEARASLEKMIKHHEKHGFSIGPVYEKESGLFVGRAGLIYLEQNDTQPDLEIGYSLLQTFWGKGYATELAKALVDWGFANLTVDKLVGVTHPDNIDSQRVLEKAGMHYVGKAHCYDTEVAKFEILKKL